MITAVRRGNCPPQQPQLYQHKLTKTEAAMHTTDESIGTRDAARNPEVEVLIMEKKRR